MPEENPNYEDWEVRGEDQTTPTYVGVVEGGIPVFHEESEDRLLGASLDEKTRELILERDRGPSIRPGETLGEAIERVGEELGWESLSVFAHEHLDSGKTTDSESDES